MKKLKLLDLFSGIGGFSLGLESTGGFETIAFVEKDDFCQKVLKKHWPNTTIEGDIRNVKGDKYEADVITGGFPCQPFSVAGKRKGKDDDRYLWDETIRVVRECKPRWFIGENVEGLININNGVVLRQVQDDLEKEGFEVQCLVIPASGIGAWHQRKRIWIMGYSKHNGYSSTKIRTSNNKTKNNSEKGENKTSEFERTSGQKNNGDVWMDVPNTNTRFSNGKNKKIQAGRTSINNGSEDVSNSNYTRNRTSKYDNNKKWEKINKEHEKFSQFEFSGHCENVSNTNSIGFGRGNIQRCSTQGWSFLQREQEGREMGSEIKGCNEYVSNSESISSNDGKSRNNSKEKQIQFKTRRENSNGNVSNSNDEGLQRLNSESSIRESEFGFTSNKNDERRETWWQTQSRICGVPHGVSFELDKNRNNRIKSLGNSIVPQIVREIGFAILESEN